MERFIYAQIKILVDPYYYRACHITYLKISQTITYGWFYFNKLILSLSSRILFLNSRSFMLLFFSRRSDYCSIWCVKNGMETHTALGNLLVQICMIWKLLVALSRLSDQNWNNLPQILQCPVRRTSSSLNVNLRVRIIISDSWKGVHFKINKLRSTHNVQLAYWRNSWYALSPAVKYVVRFQWLKDGMTLKFSFSSLQYFHLA